MRKRCGAIAVSLVLVVGMFLSLTACSSEKYVPQGKTPSVSVPTISTEGVLRVGVDANSSPYAGSTTSSGIVGINVDIAAAIADEWGLKLEIVDYGSDPAAALEAGTVDIVMGIDKSDNTMSFWVSDAYIESGVALFSLTENATLPTDGSTQIAAQASSMSAWEVTKQFGEDALISTEDLKTAFADLNSGTVGFVAADAVIGTFAAQQNGSAAKAIGLLQSPTRYGIGVSDANTDLKQLISDTLVKLEGNGMIALIETKWLGTSYDFNAMPRTAAAGDEVFADEQLNSETEGEAAPEGENPEGEAPADDGTSGIDESATINEDTNAEGENTGEDENA